MTGSTRPRWVRSADTDPSRKLFTLWRRNRRTSRLCFHVERTNRSQKFVSLNGGALRSIFARPAETQEQLRPYHRRVVYLLRSRSDSLPCWNAGTQLKGSHRKRFALTNSDFPRRCALAGLYLNLKHLHVTWWWRTWTADDPKRGDSKTFCLWYRFPSPFALHFRGWSTWRTSVSVWKRVLLSLVGLF